MKELTHVNPSSPRDPTIWNLSHDSWFGPSSVCMKENEGMKGGKKEGRVGWLSAPHWAWRAKRHPPSSRGREGGLPLPKYFSVGTWIKYCFKNVFLLLHRKWKRNVNTICISLYKATADTLKYLAGSVQANDCIASKFQSSRNRTPYTYWNWWIVIYHPSKLGK